MTVFLGSPGVMCYECPMCSLSCSSSSSLQEHVELHLEYGSASATGMCILISMQLHMNFIQEMLVSYILV